MTSELESKTEFHSKMKINSVIISYPDLTKSNKNYVQKFLTCVVCLNLINNPMQCSKCETLICGMCLDVLSLTAKCTFGNCTGIYKKASRILREYICLCFVYCSVCSVDMSYTTYTSSSHMLKCYEEQCMKEKIFKNLKVKEEKINKLEEDVNNLRFKNKIITRMNTGKLMTISMDLLRNTLMSFNLPIDNKMELYYTCTEGRLEEFENLIVNKKYPLLEEISFREYYWTPLHYSMHYGQFEVVHFILNRLKSDNLVQPAMRLQSNDGRCPLMCLLKSNHLNCCKKEELFEKIVKCFSIDLSKDVKKEAISRGMDKILKRLEKKN